MRLIPANHNHTKSNTNHRRKISRASSTAMRRMISLSLGSFFLISFSISSATSASLPPKPPSQSNPDLVPPAQVRLSHSGLHVNLPSCPLQPLSDSTSTSSFTSTPLLSLYLDVDEYDPQSVRLEISDFKRRSWENITYDCGVGGIENCREMDLEQIEASKSPTSIADCLPISKGNRDRIPGRLDFHLQDCLIKSQLQSPSDSQSTTLISTVLKVTIDLRPSSITLSNSSSTDHSKTVSQSFWLAHLVNPSNDHRALWPLQVMENPYLPKAAVVKDSDPDHGVDMGAAFWKLGLSIRAPVGDFNASTSIEPTFRPLTDGDGKKIKARLEAEEIEEAEALERFWQDSEDGAERPNKKRSQRVFSAFDSASASDYPISKDGLPSGQVTLLSLLPSNTSLYGYSPILSPVGGQVVYIGRYEIPVAPISGPGADLNNERGVVIQIRDEFGFVYQIFGLSPLRVAVQMAQLIERGQFLGGLSRRPLSYTPLSRRKPADLPKNLRDLPDVKKAKYYPYRFRELRLNVARPNPRWTEWKEPYEPGWQYFNPLNFLSTGSDSDLEKNKYRSNIPPYGNPNTIYFARPPNSKEEAISGSWIPNAFASSSDILMPTLSGRVELVTGFESFFNTPGDEEDGLDGLAVNRLEWGLVRKVEEGQDATKKVEKARAADQSCVVQPDEYVDWRLSFEHHKLPMEEPASTTISTSSTWYQQDQDQRPLSNSTSLSHPSSLLLRSYFLPAFSTGLFFKSYQTSSFDEKSRHLLYSPTRNIRGYPALGPEATWNTREEEDGDYELIIKAGDWWGNEGCVRSKVRIRNL